MYFVLCTTVIFQVVCMPLSVWAFDLRNQDSRPVESMYELPHSENDGRCPNRKSETVSVQIPEFGIVRGRTVALCYLPEMLLNEKLGEERTIIRVFLGIPYAEPPVGDRQFKPLSRLFHNYSVMVYIHGGNWDHGSSNLFPPHMLAIRGVIVVTFNYRIGHLGFLSTGDNASVGNYGILDQIAALKWVYKHIHSFGGNQSSITLFGSDVGGVSASLLAMSPLSRYMVRRIIAQNGSPLADWATITNPRFSFNTSHILGEALGCAVEDSFKLVACIRTRTNNEYKYLNIKPFSGWLPWGPVIDNFTLVKNSDAFLLKSPEEMLENGLLFDRDFSVLLGTCKDEGLTVISADQLSKMKYEFSTDDFKKRIRELQSTHNYSVNAQSVFDAIEFMYKPSMDIANLRTIKEAYVNLLTDYYYKAPIYKFGKHLVQNDVRTYLYVFNYTLQGYYPHSRKGISSETEYLLLSGAPFMDPKYYPPYLNLNAARWTAADRKMSLFYLQSWTDFAKYGNPTKNSFMNTILWEPASKENFIFLNLNGTSETVEMIKDYRKQECEFWNCYLPLITQRQFSTLAPTLEPGVEELRLMTGALYGSIAAGVLFLVITIACSSLYCRIRKQDSY